MSEAAKAMVDSGTYNTLYEVANVDDSVGLLDNFRPQYLSHAFQVESKLNKSRNKTPEACAKKLLDKLKGAATAVEEANKLYDTMDREHFEALMRSENGFVTSGVDLEKGRKVLFIRPGHYCEGLFGHPTPSVWLLQGIKCSDMVLLSFPILYLCTRRNLAIQSRYSSRRCFRGSEQFSVQSCCRQHRS